MKLLHSVQGMGVRPARYSSDERLHHLLLEALLEVDDVIRDAQVLRDVARVVNVVERAAAAGGLSPESSGRRRWFQSCMVRPTTASAARVQHARDDGAVDSARHGDGNRIGVRHRRAQVTEVRDALGDRVDQRVHLPGVIRAAERKAQAGAGLLACEADGGENMRRLGRAAGTGRAAGDREAAQVERDQQRLAVDAVEPQIGGVGRAARRHSHPDR